jgi:hypothetical protein
VATCDHPAPPRRWGGWIPGALLVGLCSLRLLPGPDVGLAAEARRLEELGTAAAAEGRWAAAAEYARHAISRRRGQPGEDALRLLRGEALIEAGEKDAGATLLRRVVATSADPAIEERALELLAAAGLGTSPSEQIAEPAEAAPGR